MKRAQSYHSKKSGSTEHSFTHTYSVLKYNKRLNIHPLLYFKKYCILKYSSENRAAVTNSKLHDKMIFLGFRYLLAVHTKMSAWEERSSEQEGNMGRRGRAQISPEYHLGCYEIIERRRTCNQMLTRAKALRGRRSKELES